MGARKRELTITILASLQRVPIRSTSKATETKRNMASTCTSSKRKPSINRSSSSLARNWQGTYNTWTVASDWEAINKLEQGCQARDGDAKRQMRRYTVRQIQRWFQLKRRRTSLTWKSYKVHYLCFVFKCLNYSLTRRMLINGVTPFIPTGVEAEVGR